MSMTLHQKLTGMICCLPALLLLGCGMTPEDMDAQSQALEQQQRVHAVHEIQPTMKKIDNASQVTTRTRYSREVFLVPPTLAPGTKHIVKAERCGELMVSLQLKKTKPAKIKKPGDVVAPGQPSIAQPSVPKSANITTDKQPVFQFPPNPAGIHLVWDVLSAHMGASVRIYISTDDEAMKLQTPTGQGYIKTEKSGENGLYLHFQAPEQLGRYSKLLFFHYKGFTYKLPICYTVYN